MLNIIYIYCYYGFACTDADISSFKPRPDPYLVRDRRCLSRPIYPESGLRCQGERENQMENKVGELERSVAVKVARTSYWRLQEYCWKVRIQDQIVCLIGSVLHIVLQIDIKSQVITWQWVKKTHVWEACWFLFHFKPFTFFSNAKETANKKLVTSIHKLEGDVQSLRPGSETIPLRCTSRFWGAHLFGSWGAGMNSWPYSENDPRSRNRSALSDIEWR